MYISQCIIVKNEENSVRNCLSHLQSIVDEQIVVDTGSTDRTVEIAKSLGAKVFHFEWIDDFSAARNYALDKAKGDWVIFLDCDEYFSKDSVPLIRKCIKDYGEHKNVEGLISDFINIKSNGEIISTAKNISSRIYKRKSYIRYKNKIHETLVNKNRTDESPVLVDVSNILKIFHTGYDKEIVKEKNKNERNIELLKRELEKDPANIKLNYYLSRQLHMDGKYEISNEYCLKTLNYIEDYNQFDYYRTIYNTIMMNKLALLKPYEEIKIIFNEATNKYPSFPDYYRLLGMAALREYKSKEAVELLEKCIELCENYNSDAESLALGNIDDIYDDLLSAYKLENNKHKVVEIAVAMLKVNKYNIKVLIILLNTFLTQEKEENIIEFLRKVYNYTELKDKIYLFKACKTIDNEKLLKYYEELLTDEELKAINNF